jgi:hypothetical protein
VKHLGTCGFVLRQFFCVAQGGRQPGEFTGGGVRTRGGSVLSGGLAFSHLLRFALGCRMFFSGSGGGTLGFEFFLRFAQRVMFGFAARQRLITQFRFRSKTCTCGLGCRLVGAGTKFEFLARGMFSLGALGGTGARMIATSSPSCGMSLMKERSIFTLSISYGPAAVNPDFCVTRGPMSA